MWRDQETRPQKEQWRWGLEATGKWGLGRFEKGGQAMWGGGRVFI